MAQGKRSKLSEVRWRRGLSRARAARTMGVHPVTLARWETGCRLPRWPQMIEWAEIAGIEPEAAKALFIGAWKAFRKAHQTPRPAPKDLTSP
jgi:DNA-binding XRE family transcriptional regulator